MLLFLQLATHRVFREVHCYLHLLKGLTRWCMLLRRDQSLLAGTQVEAGGTAYRKTIQLLAGLRMAPLLRRKWKWILTTGRN